MLQHGILHESSCVYTPSQNGVTECKNRHLLEVAHALLFQMTVPKPFWANAVSMAYFLIKCMPSVVLGGNYPYSVLFETKPLFPIDPKIFGSTCFARDTQPNITKLDPKSHVTFHEDLPYFLVTTYHHQEENDDLLVYVSPTHVPTTKQSAKPDDAPINVPSDSPGESDSPPASPAQYSDSDAPSDFDSPPTSPVPELDLLIAIRKGKRTCTYLISSFVSYDRLSPSSRAFVANLDSISVLKNVGEALAHSGWYAAMIEEMNALDHNIARLKACSVAKGYAQTYGIDYSETFSPVAMIYSIWLFISLASTYDWALHQLDVKNAFLHGDLQEEVYMEQPLGFVAQGESRRVCCILLVVYVDDIVIMSSNKAGIKKLKTFIGDAGQIEAKPCDEPIIPKLKLKSEDGRLLQNPEKYRRVVGKLNYLTITHPDIEFLVSVVSQFLTAPRTSHWDAVTQIMLEAT
ncbi:polyprotein [Tanacetum coccineum]